MRSDFFLAASAVLPILIFAEAVTQTITVRVRSQEVADRIERAKPRVVVLAALVWWPFYGWAEWICMRSLETGRAATGGTTVVWIALALAAIQLAGTDVAARLSAAMNPS
jgi:hypothetical protein